MSHRSEQRLLGGAPGTAAAIPMPPNPRHYAVHLAYSALSIAADQVLANPVDEVNIRGQLS